MRYGENGQSNSHSVSGSQAYVIRWPASLLFGNRPSGLRPELT